MVYLRSGQGLLGERRGLAGLGFLQGFERFFTLLSIKCATALLADSHCLLNPLLPVVRKNDTMF
ncbi:hypothetical protein DKK66_11395 [Aquitalea sp. USM4]|nr:hypothetical protein DKK66_11395 [Aquitalea sp. USM4]